jgi:LysR family transcriptional regulator, transcriptional activator of the cysJI operon
VIAAFHEQYPGVDLQVFFGTSAEVVEAVRMHRVEMGFVGGFAGAVDLTSTPLVEDDIVVVGPPALADASPGDLEDVTWISREEGSATRAAIEAAWADLGISPQRRLEMPSWEAVKLVVAGGAGVAACSRFAIQLELQAGVLAIIPLPRWNIHRTISLVSGRDAPSTLVADRFAAMVQERWAPAPP